MVGNAWGDTVTFDPASDKSFPKDGISISVSNGTLTNGTDYRVYKNATMTISSTVGTITNIALTYSSAANDGGGWASSYQPNATSWTSPTADGEQARIKSIVVTYVSANKATAPTLPASCTFTTESMDVTITNGETGATIYYTTDGTDPTTSSTSFTGASKTINISATTTVKAMAVISGKSNSSVATATYTKEASIANTAETAYTVAEAIALIDANSSQLKTTEVYVKGTISKVDSYNATYGSITYWLDDNAFEIYGGLGLEGAKFVAATDLQVGDEIVVKGLLKKFTSGSNTTYEMDKNNVLVSRKTTATKTSPTLDLISNKNVLSEGATDEFTINYNGNGELSATSSDITIATVSVNDNTVTVNALAAGTTTITISASETDNYYYAKKTYTLTVNEAPSEDENVATFIYNEYPNIWNVEPSNSTAGNYDIGQIAGKSLVSGKVTMTCTDGNNPTMFWGTSTYDLRVYKKGSVTFTASEGYYISEILVKGETVTDLTVSTGKLAGDKVAEKTWTGNSNSVTFSVGESTNNKWHIAVVTIVAGTPSTPDPVQYEYVYAPDATDIVSGDYVVVVPVLDEIKNDLVYKAVTSTLDDGYLNVVDVEVQDNAICELNGATVWTVTSSIVDNNPSLSFKAGDKYIATNNGSLTLSSTPEVFINYRQIYTSDFNYWFGYADGLMLSQNDENCPEILFFKKTDIAKHSLNFIAYENECMDNIYYATFSSDNDTFFPSEYGLTAYSVNVDGEGSLKLDALAEGSLKVDGQDLAGTYIPANTGVLLSNNFDETDYYNVYNKDIPALAEGVTMLRPASAAMEGDYKFYKLAYDDYTNKTGLGFYYGATNGGAFTCKAGTAYLAVPSDQAVKSFTLSGAATGIKNVETATKSVIYNLNGQRMNKMQKGINIVDGKKYLVK